MPSGPLALRSRVPLDPAVTSRRPRSVPHLSACRSLDSYREGRRGASAREGEYERVDGGGRQRQPRKSADAEGDKQLPRPPRTKIGLLKALLRAKVASGETCELLLRAGFVTVNGIVKQDATMRVDLAADVLAVKGKDLEFDVEESGAATHINDWDDSVEEEATLTRAQRDFKKGKFAQEGRAVRSKRYSRDVDGGFYAGKQWLKRK